jgi:hypothetical protein
MPWPVVAPVVLFVRECHPPLNLRWLADHVIAIRWQWVL